MVLGHNRGPKSGGGQGKGEEGRPRRISRWLRQGHGTPALKPNCTLEPMDSRQGPRLHSMGDMSALHRWPGLAVRQWVPRDPGSPAPCPLSPQPSGRRTVPLPHPEAESLQSLPLPPAVFAPQGHSRLQYFKDSQGGGRPPGRVGGDLGQASHRSPRVTLCPPPQL